MRKEPKFLSILIIPTFLITSCGCSMAQSSDEKLVDVYDLDILEGTNKESCHVGKVKALFRTDQYYVPYLSLNQYAELYDSHFANGTTSSVAKRGDLITWTIYTQEGLCFISQIDVAHKTILSAGSISAAYKANDDPIDYGSLYYGSTSTYDGGYAGDSIYSRYSYADIEMNTITSFGNVYFPLGFLDTTYSYNSNIYFYYNYAGIYSTRTIENYYTTTFESEGTSLTVNKEMAKYKTTSSMPAYLKDYNANMFMYLLDNFYGLKEYKGIKTAKEYCQQAGTYNNLFSDNDQERAQAYADTLAKLDDNHTGLVAGNEAWGENVFDVRPYGDGCKARSELRVDLINKRKSMMNSTYYAQNNEPVFSSDGQTAMFYFDSFIFGSTEQVFDNNGQIKDDAWYYDSFLSISRLFNNLKARGGVRNVILDISTNGGGVLGVLMKVLALISIDNTSNLFYFEASNQQYGIASTRVDVDDNGVYDLDDCFGDDFNIYLLTSDCSFSCGNALPCLAQIEGTAKIIGQKSGGGECAVGMHYLPNGEYVYHSSSLHLGYFDTRTKQFIGFEDGAEPDIVVDDYNDFYNIDRLASYISIE